MKTILPLFFICLLQFTASCNKIDCFETAGPVETSVRNIQPFQQIDVYDDINLVITQDTIESIEVQCGKYLQPNIIAETEKGIVTLHNNTTCKWLRNSGEKVTVYAHVKTLNKINYESSGNITATNTIKIDNLNVISQAGAGSVTLNIDAQQTSAYIHNENADFIFSGASNECNTFINARGTIDFTDFEVKKMNIEYAGVRNATINVTEELRAIVYHTGNLYYKGNPAIVDSKQLGRGQLIKVP